MKEILYNLALIEAINYCKRNNVDCSGTRLIKIPRKQSYVLQPNNLFLRGLVQVNFYKNSITTFSRPN